MLVPQPVQLELGDSEFTLSATCRVFAPDAPQVAALLRELLGPVTGFALPSADRPGPGTIGLLIDPAVTEAEGYRLVVTEDQVTASAGTVAGLRWAVQTLRQLLPPQIYGSGTATSSKLISSSISTTQTWTIPAATIVDAPKYPWRGLMVDVGRWYKPIEWLYTVVELLALHRMNVLHLHLTEDQGWRFQVLHYPKLTSVGAFREESPRGHGSERIGDGNPHGGFYTQRELRDLVAFAERRGVTIVPEIDLPGHTQAAIAAYPELGNDPGRGLSVWTGFGVSPHVLNAEERTVTFILTVLDELLDVFPSPYIHLGGDEVLTGEWAASPAAQARITELGLDSADDLLGWWIGRLAEHVESRGRRVVLWDELIGRGAPPNALIMAWRGEDRVKAALTAGYDVVATPHTSMYLNYPASSAPGEPLSIADGVTTDGIGVLPLSRVYAYDPQPDGPFAGEAAVIGAQGNLWTEYAPTPARAEYDLMPRLSAVAEVGWGTSSGEVDDLARRLNGHLQRLDAAGIGYRPLDPVPPEHG
jgi:hexosaminidase